MASQPAPERILRAVVRRAATGGVGALSLNEVASDAGVSKGLVLYHFSDKMTLLASAMGWIARRTIARESRALDGVTPRAMLDALWDWIARELSLGELRVLGELGHTEGTVVRDAARIAALDRHAAAARTAERIFAALELASRVPAPLLAAVLVAFVDGLATATPAGAESPAADGTSHSPAERGRPAFDVLWLALLGLAD